MDGPVESDGTNLAENLERLSTASLQSCPDDWMSLVTLLKLTPIHAIAIQEVLRQGRWRGAKNPKAYIRVAAVRQLERMGLGENQTAPDTLLIPKLTDYDGHKLTHDSYIDYLSFDGPVKEGSKWKHRNPDFYDERDYDEEGHGLRRHDRLLADVPREFKRLEPLPEIVREIHEGLNSDPECDVFFPTDPKIVINWPELARSAGLDRGEYYVLLCRARGISRDRVVAKWKTERKKKWIQAAWRRLDRSGLKRLRAAMALPPKNAA